MVVLSEEIADTDLTVVTFMQTIRLLSAVSSCPSLSTEWPRPAGRRLPPELQSLITVYFKHHGTRF